LRASPYPTGVDGYWYLIQARSLLEHGHLHFPSAPLVPWLMAATTLIVEPVLALKTIAALGSAALVLSSYAIARRITGERGPALLGAALAATSAQSFFLGTEFVKQGVGLALALGFVAGLAAAIERPGKTRFLVAVALLVTCALAHKTALGLALIAGSPLAVARLWPNRRHPAVLAGLATLAAGALAASYFGRAQLAPLGHLFHHRADWTFAVLAVPGGIPLVLGHEVALAAGLAIVALCLAAFRRATDGPRLPALAIGFVCFAVFLGLPWLDIANDQGLGYRLRLCACACLAPCSSLVASQLLRRARPATRTALLALLIGGVLTLRPWRSEEGVIRAHPAMVEATARLAGLLPPQATVVVPERHTAFMATWYGRVNTRLRPPPIVDTKHTFRLLPGAAIRPGLWAALDELRFHPVAGVAPSVDLHSLHPNGLVLLPENTFAYLLASLPESERRWYLDWVVQ
jgi:hypothetical protein